MKTIFIFFLSIVLFLGCKSGTGSNSDTAGDQMGVSENNSQNQTWSQDKVTDFVNKVAIKGLMEVQLGQIAQQKALSQQVKDFGKMMEKDHGDANNKLKTAVQSLSLTLPASLDQEHQNKIDDMNKKTGKDFDTEYMNEMVRDHENDIKDFEDAQKNLPTGELKTWVDNTLPVLRQHHIQAQTIQDQLKNQK